MTMESNVIKGIILFFVVAEYVIEQLLSHLNRRAASPVLPAALTGLYDERQYAEQQRYFAVNNRFGSMTDTIMTGTVVVLLCTGLFGRVDAWVQTVVSGSLLWSTLLFFGLLFLANILFTLPFQIYDTFVIEQRFGFNKMTPGTFASDQLKSLVVNALMGGVLLSVIVLSYEWLGHRFWMVMCAVIVAFMLLLNMFYSQWIVPLFNRQTPLPEGELRMAIEDFARRSGFCIDDIFIIDGSRRSTKANAYFSGLGPRKRIVLYDTLIQELTTEEIVAVLAHETGHYKHRHTLQMLLLSVLNVVLMSYLFSLTLDNAAFAEALGGSRPSFALSLVAFSLLYAPVGMVTGWLVNAFSRRNEYQADAFAARYGLAGPLMDGLKKISVKALSNLTPHPLYVKVYYSHPTLLQRMEALRKTEKNEYRDCRYRG